MAKPIVSLPPFRRFLPVVLLSLLATASLAAPRIDVRDYGVTPDSSADATHGIERAIAAAKEHGATVFLPAGTYRHTSFTLDGVRLSGEGAGRTILLAPDPARQKIRLTGTGPALTDLSLRTSPQPRRSGQDAIQVDKDCREFKIANLEIDGSNATGMIVSGNVGRITGNRIVNTRADSIHISGGASEIYIAGNLVRNSGDDCIAVVSYGKHPSRCRDILIENNDVGEQFWGRGITVVGGEHVTIRDNLIRSTAGAGIYIASESSYQTHGVSDAVIENNTLDQSPFDRTAGGHHAITVYSSTDHWIEKLRIEGNQVTASAFGPFRAGKSRGKTREVYTTGNSFPTPESDTVDPGATGARISPGILGGNPVDPPADTAGFGQTVTQQTFSLSSSTWSGKTLRELDSRKSTGARVVTVSTGEREIKSPPPEHILQAGDRLLVTGAPSQLDAFGARLNGG